MSESSDSFVAECFWTGVTERDVADLDERIRSAVSAVAADGQPVRYAGSILMPTDEVVLCLFEGSEDLVKLAAQQAGVPFNRIVPTSTHQITSMPPGGDAS